MEDSNIVELFWLRSEQAITETRKKYEKLLYSVARNILSIHEDAEECVNDTYLSAWNAMPKARPKYLSAFLCRITKNKAFDKYEYLTAEKRNRNMEVSLSEMEHALTGMDYEYAEKELIQAINQFLGQQTSLNRNIFVRRYFFYDSIDSISKRFRMKPDAIKTRLRRVRNQLKDYLVKEGYYVGP